MRNLITRPAPRTLSQVATRVADREDLRQALVGLPVILPIVALIVWSVSIRGIEASQMNDLGLVSILPPLFFAAIALLTGSFCLELHHRAARVPVLLLHVVVLIAILYGTPTLVEGTPRFAATWKHMGVAGFIADNGYVNPRIDAYFNWPGFFAFAAFVKEITGFQDFMVLAQWAHIIFSLLFLLPLVLILRSVSTDVRLIWVGVWFYFLSNWVGQDYFAPQAFGYFFYLMMVAIVLNWFKTTSPQPSFFTSMQERAHRFVPRAALLVDRISQRDVGNVASSSWQRVGLMAAIVLLGAAMIPTHQVTPFAALFTVGMLVAFDRITPRSLPVILGVLIVAWMFYMAITYFAGHLEPKLGQVGALNQNVNKSVGQRIGGSPDHIFVVQVRMIMTFAIGILAIAGGFRRILKGHWDLTLAILAIAPVLLIGVQSHGGEMALRIYFYVLPAMVFFAAALFFADPGSRSRWPSTIAVGLVSLALCAGFLVARYGNERMDYFSPQEIEAINYLYDNAEPGSVFLKTGTMPWKFKEYTTFRWSNLEGSVVREQDTAGIAEQMSHSKNDMYLVITRSSKASRDLFSGLGPGRLAALEQALLQSDQFEVAFRNQDATIFTVVDKPDAAGR